ncbi:hypothetical protein [Paenibacillus sp. 7541]|uniref:prenylated flavin chaperone LpdD n=1 Tax=Paenibacillus sp. 7541 TaxID=2026236 RepID=UPI0015958FD0|nr:hypothetical protein [Paenibacillus sp. 7541]
MVPFQGKFDDIQVECKGYGEDVLFTITGGASHIGAISTAYRTAQRPGFAVDTIRVPGHKEYLLTGEFALKAAERLDRQVTVVMGIHYPGLTREETEAIVFITRGKLEKVLVEWQQAHV